MDHVCMRIHTIPLLTKSVMTCQVYGPTTLSFVIFDQHRRLLKQQAGMKYRNRVDARTFLTVRKGDMELPEDEVEQVFQQQT